MTARDVGLPDRHPAAGLPERVTIYEVGPRDGLQNEPALVPTEVKAEFIDRLARRRAADRRGDQLRAPEVGAAAGRRRRADARGSTRGAGRDLPGAGAQRARPRPGAGAGRAATSRSSAAPPRRSRRRTSTAASTSSSRCSSRPYAGRATPGLDVRAYVSMCFGDPWEGAVPDRAGRRRRPAAVRPRRQPAQPRRHDRRRHRRATSPRCSTAFARGRRRRPTRSPCTSTTPTARRCPTPWPPCAPASPPSTPAPAASAAAPTPRAPPATSPPRTWSGCSGLGIEHGVDLDALVETSLWMAEPARQTVTVPGGHRRRWLFKDYQPPQAALITTANPCWRASVGGPSLATPRAAGLRTP